MALQLCSLMANQRQVLIVKCMRSQLMDQLDSIKMDTLIFKASSCMQLHNWQILINLPSYLRQTKEELSNRHENQHQVETSNHEMIVE